MNLCVFFYDEHGSEATTLTAMKPPSPLLPLFLVIIIFYFFSIVSLYLPSMPALTLQSTYWLWTKVENNSQSNEAQHVLSLHRAMFFRRKISIRATRRLLCNWSHYQLSNELSAVEFLIICRSPYLNTCSKFLYHVPPTLATMKKSHPKGIPNSCKIQLKRRFFLNILTLRFVGSRLC